jgi:hypothetical protein
MLISCNQDKLSTVSYLDWRYNQQNNSSSDNKLRKTYELTDGLFIEEYNTYEGIGLTRMVTVYLTDSINFKETIANFDEHMSYDVIYDSIRNCVKGIGLKYKAKADSILRVDTIDLNKYSKSYRMDSVYINAPITGDETDCDNPKLRNKFEVYNSTIPKGFTLVEEDYSCKGDYLRFYYLNSERNLKILLTINQNSTSFPYTFENLNDSVILLNKVKSYDIYDTLFVNTLYIDSLIRK